VVAGDEPLAITIVIGTERHTCSPVDVQNKTGKSYDFKLYGMW